MAWLGCSIEILGHVHTSEDDIQACKVPSDWEHHHGECEAEEFVNYAPVSC